MSIMDNNSIADAKIKTEEINTTMLLDNMTYVDAMQAVSDFQFYVSIIVPILFGLICVIGLFGNSLVILVVLCEKHMRSSTNILILSLAVADLLFIVLSGPFTAIKYALAVWMFGDIFCKVTQYTIYVSAYASIYTLMLMSLDRYLAVVHAIPSITLRSEKNTWIAVLVMWIIILCGNTPLLVQYGEYHYDFNGQNRSACINVRSIDDVTTAQAFFGTFFFFSYVIPLGIIVVMYGLMLVRLLYGVVPGGGIQSPESVRAKKRVTIMVVIVIVIFGICWLPVQIIIFYVTVLKKPNTENISILLLASNCLAYMNSCVNPILYAFLSDNFRRSFRKFLCCNESSRRML